MLPDLHAFPTLSIALLVYAAVLVGCNGATPSVDVTNNDKEATETVRVEDFRLVQTPEGKRQVMGQLYNTTAEAIAAAQIRVSLFGAAGTRVATVRVVVHDVPPEDRVPFKAPLRTGKRIEGARVHSVLVP